MKRKFTIICIINILTVLVVVAANSLSFKNDKTYFLNRFGKLTSEVWRYKSSFVARDLKAVANNNPQAIKQPKRDRPTRVELNKQGTKAYVSLQGTEERPGDQIAVIDLSTNKVTTKIKVGKRPYTIKVHPTGRYAVVINEFSNYASVIDMRSDENIGKIALDYYCQGLVFSKNGKVLYIANRYLDQVLVVDITENENGLSGKVRKLYGYSVDRFNGTNTTANTHGSLKDRGYSEEELTKGFSGGVAGINTILRSRCKNCHAEGAGGFVSGPDINKNFLSAIENSISGTPKKSILLRAVTPKSIGGFGDVRTTSEYHPGGKLFEENDPDLKRVEQWIEDAKGGPGIDVGNDMSHPKDLVLSSDEKFLFVGNTGTKDVSIIDTVSLREVGGIYIENVANNLAIYRHKSDSDLDHLIILTMGAGFGAANARDPFGGETWDKKNPAAQYSVLRDPITTDAYKVDEQFVLGPYDAIDGTWNTKMRDIQNDIIALKLSSLHYPKFTLGMELNYLLKPIRYESHDSWVRYTSDTAEATTGDVKGDIPPELQRVPGAFPEWIEVVDDKMYVSMAGTFEIVEWQINARATDPSEKLVPLRKFATGLRPVGLTIGRSGYAKNKLFVANQIGETLNIIDLTTNENIEIVVGDLSVPLFKTQAEKGELIVHSSVFTSDGDTSCLHCHYRDTGDGRGWGAAETVGQDVRGHLTPGGTLGIPSMRNTFAIQPYYFEGTHDLSEGQGADVNEPASSIDFDRPIWAGDFSKIRSPIPSSKRVVMHEELKERVEVNSLGEKWYDLEEARNEFFKKQTKKYFGKELGLRDVYPFVGSWLGDNNHLLPNPIDTENPSVKRGQKLFNSAQVMCIVCHSAPEFTNKTLELANNDRRALPVLITTSRRDASYTLTSVHAVDYANGIKTPHKGRVEDKEGTFTTMHLRNLFDRPPVFLHHGRARSLREVLLTPGHPATKKFRYPVLLGGEDVRPGRMEKGFNELQERNEKGELILSGQIFDSHGGTSHLSIRQIDDLENFIKAIE